MAGNEKGGDGDQKEDLETPAGAEVSAEPVNERAEVLDIFRATVKKDAQDKVQNPANVQGDARKLKETPGEVGLEVLKAKGFLVRLGGMIKNVRLTPSILYYALSAILEVTLLILLFHSDGAGLESLSACTNALVQCGDDLDTLSDSKHRLEVGWGECNDVASRIAIQRDQALGERDEAEAVLKDWQAFLRRCNTGFEDSQALVRVFHTGFEDASELNSLLRAENQAAEAVIRDQDRRLAMCGSESRQENLSTASAAVLMDVIEGLRQRVVALETEAEALGDGVAQCATGRFSLTASTAATGSIGF